MRVVKKPEERRAEMVAAAAKLFAQQGFVKTSVAEIVSAVDVAKGLFYYYFTTKDDMVRAVVEGYCSYLGARARKIAQQEGSAQQKLRELMDRQAWHACFTAPLLADLCLPQHAALYSDMCDRVYAHMRPAVCEIARQALIERGEDPARAEILVGVILYGAMMMARRSEIDMDMTEEMIIRLLGCGKDAA